MAKSEMTSKMRFFLISREIYLRAPENSSPFDPHSPWVDCCRGTNTRFTKCVENSHALLPKLGQIPTFASKRGIWHLSREIQLRAPEKSCSFDPHSPRVHCRQGTNTQLATSVEKSHVSPLKIGKLPAKTVFGVYFARYNFQSPVQPYHSFYLAHGWTLVWWSERNSL